MRTGLVRLSFLLIPAALAVAFLAPGRQAPASEPLSGNVTAPPPLPARSHTMEMREVEDLRQDLEYILTSAGNRSGRWSVLAVSLDQGDTLLSLHSGDPMVPASNMKLFTTAAALYALGPDFRYTTFLLSRGQERDGGLDGDLILYGTGDPTFSPRFFPGESPVLDSLAASLRRRGIQEVHGDLIVDGSYFKGPEIHPEWDPADLNEHFAAPIAALSFNENLVRVQVRANRVAGRPPEIHLTPRDAGIPIMNKAITAPAGSRSRVWLFRDTPWDPIGIEGEIPLGGRDVWRELPVPDPLVFTGRVLKRVLEEEGIQIHGDLRVLRTTQASILGGTSPTSGPGSEPEPRILAVHQSPPLLDILTVVNKKSNNLLAETVARTLGRLTTGDGSFQGGMEAVEDFLTKVVGVSSREIALRDGSGLSAQNRASAGALVQVLTFMAHSELWEDFWGTLPEAGVRQELRRMSGSPAARNLRAKTGTMEGVSALSGMVRTRSGERVLFSIISNEVSSEYRAKRAEDQLGIRLASLTRSTGPNRP